MQPLPVRSLRTVLFALAVGQAFLAGLVAFLRTNHGAFGVDPAPDALTLVVALVFVGTAVTCLFFQSAAKKALLADRDGARLHVKGGSVPPALARAAIVGAALAEGSGLLAVVVVLIGGPLLLFAVPAASVIWIVLLVPSQERLENHLKDMG